VKPAAAVGLLAFVGVGFLFWSAQAPAIVAVRPETETVPSNFLRLYIDFSRPMAGEDAFEHIHLLDAAGKPIEDAFREIELWSRDNRRLMLYVHPGRVKSGLALGDQFGPVIEQGKTYTLRILPGMKARNGRVVGTGFRRTLRVGGPDHEGPDLTRWRIEASPQRVEIDCDDWLDHAGLEEFLAVEGVPGLWSVDGRRVTFLPSRRLEPGEYRLVVDARLEDLCGNNFIRPFETPSGATPLPSERPAFVVRTFMLVRSR
jgi:hypothetical protein